MRSITLLAFVLLTGCASQVIQPAKSPVTLSRKQLRSQLVVTPKAGVAIVHQELVHWTYDDPTVTFNLYYSWTSPRAYDHVITGITNLNCVVSNMVPGTTYYLATTAVDTNGLESDFSAQCVFVMPTTLEFGFAFDRSVANVSVQSSTNLTTWQASNARPRTNGLWIADVDSKITVEFFRGVGESAPAL